VEKFLASFEARPGDSIHLGLPDRFDVYYGMADDRIGGARLDLPDSLPTGGIAAQPKGKG
jgi:hypothetical protein